MQLPEPDTRSFLPAVGISRRDMERVGQILLAMRRFRQAMRKGKRTAPRAFLAKSYLDEALLLYEIFLEATDGDIEHLEWWYDQRDEFAKVKQPSREVVAKANPAQKAQRARRFRRRTSP